MCSSSRHLHILDTSAIRGLGKERLRAIGKRIPLAVSPYTVLELLSHLSEGEFLRFKAEISKLDDIDILRFPQTELPMQQASSRAMLNWVSLRNSIPVILMCAKKSDSYSSFASTSVPFGNAHSRLSLSDFASRVTEDLATLKKDYMVFIDEIINDLSSYDDSSLNTPDEQRFVAHVKEAMRPSFEALRKIDPEIDEASYYDRLYPHFSFLMRRALGYAQKRRDAPSKKIDTNDYVDAYLCLHLDLQKPCVLVTQDRDLRLDLSWTLDAIRVAHSFTPECTVEDTSNLVASCASA
jgi:hypothetical protein